MLPTSPSSGAVEPLIDQFHADYLKTLQLMANTVAATQKFSIEYGLLQRNYNSHHQKLEQQKSELKLQNDSIVQLQRELNSLKTSSTGNTTSNEDQNIHLQLVIKNKTILQLKKKLHEVDSTSKKIRNELQTTNHNLQNELNSTQRQLKLQASESHKQAKEIIVLRRKLLEKNALTNDSSVDEVHFWKERCQKLEFEKRKNSNGSSSNGGGNSSSSSSGCNSMPPNAKRQKNLSWSNKSGSKKVSKSKLSTKSTSKSKLSSKSKLDFLYKLLLSGKSLTHP